MTTPVSIAVAERKWAITKLESVLRKEAFLNTLKASMENLTTDIKVGTRFISTLDYDGNLYECKQSPYEDYMTKQMLCRRFHASKIEVAVQAKRIEPHTVDILSFIRPGQAKWSPKGYYVPHTNELQTAIQSEGWEGKTITFKGNVSAGIISAQMNLATRIYRMREDEEGDYPEVKQIDFRISELYMTVGHREGEGTCLYVSGIGHYPEIERKVNRIWVRKCNLVAQALGKNIDSSKKSINFTLEEMSVRKMLDNEVEKLRKVRKIFNQSNPEKSRSVALAKLTDEHKRLEPTLNRLECLFFDLYDKDVKVPAYYCEKYGYLIPLKAQLLVDISGNTVEQELVRTNDMVRDSIESQIHLRNIMVSEVVPSALHPTRVEKEINKYGIEGVFGDDKTVAFKWVNGEKTEGVVNHSVLG